MKRLWGRMLQVLLAVLVFLYLGDWAVLWLRASGQPSSSVQVEQFLRTPLKGQKEEFDYMGTVTQPCVPSLFPAQLGGPVLVAEVAQDSVDFSVRNGRVSGTR